MEGEEDQHTRLCIMEKMFVIFQEGQVTRMRNEEIAFEKLNNQLNAIFSKINDIKDEHREIEINLHAQLKITMERDFVSNHELSTKITALKTEITNEIKATKKNAFTEFFRIVAAFTIALSFSGWLYVNVVKEIANK